MGAGLLIHLLSRLLIIKDPVKVVPLLAGSMQDVGLLAFILALHLHSVKHDLKRVNWSQKNLRVAYPRPL
jgi:hypothetical protein